MSELRTRVVLGATCYAEARVALSAAVSVAASVKGELRGILIEEETVVALAGHPGARIVTQGGRRLTGLGAASMMAALQRDAERFERDLKAAAAALQLQWSFARQAGRMAEILAEAALAGDLLVLGGAAFGQKAGEVVYLAGPQSDPILEEAAAALASELRRPLSVLLPEGAAVPDRLRTSPRIRVPSAESLRHEITRMPADTILVANLANAPAGLTDLAGARVTRILRSLEPLGKT